ncbi:hypothetical protein SAMN05216390_1392 [Lachnospiraceae bacterium KH1T2]|nr:hypothetical protein SAMN05216390_1392 [Lachnospiraceae bacterium KH1T2]
MAGLLGVMAVRTINIYFGVITLLNVVSAFIYSKKIKVLKYIITIVLAVCSAAIYGTGALIGADYGEIVTEIFYVLSIVMPTLFLMILMIEDLIKVYCKWDKKFKIIIMFMAVLYMIAALIVLAQTVMGLMYLEFGDQLRREHNFRI